MVQQQELTPREREAALELVDDARANAKTIAAKWGISEHTVHGYIKSILRKRGYHSKGEFRHEYDRDEQCRQWVNGDSRVTFRDPYLSPATCLGFPRHCWAANWESGYRRGKNLQSQWVREKRGPMESRFPDDVQSKLAQLQYHTTEKIKKERKRIVRPFFNSQIAIVDEIDNRLDDQSEVILYLNEIDWLTTISLRRNLDSPLSPEGRTIRQSFIESKIRYPVAIGSNLFLLTKDKQFLFGFRTRAVDESSYPLHFSHASAGYVITKVLEETKRGEWKNDIDPNTNPV